MKCSYDEWSIICKRRHRKQSQTQNSHSRLTHDNYVMQCNIRWKWRNPKTNLLFKISTVLLIDQNQVQIVANRELLVYVTHRRSQIVSIEEEPDWNGFASHWCTVHNLKFGDSLVFIECVWSCDRKGSWAINQYMAQKSFSFNIKNFLNHLEKQFLEHQNLFI